MRKAALAWAATLLLAAAAQADVDASARLGFGGRWIAGAATPVVVALRNSGADPVRVRIDVVLSEHLGRQDQIVSRGLALAAGVTRDETFLVPGPSGIGGVRVQIEVDPKTPLHAGKESSRDGSISFEIAARDDRPGGDVAYSSNVLGVIGDAQGVLAARVRADPENGSAPVRGRPAPRFEVFAVDASQTRLAPLGWDGLDAVLVVDPDEKFAAGPDEVDALLDWVSLGGRLVVSLGEHAAQFTGSPLARELPATWAGTTRADYGALLDALGVAHAVGASGPLTALRANATATREETETFDGGPLVVERALGAGRIVLLPYDVRRTTSAATFGDVKAALRPVLELRGVGDERPSYGLVSGAVSSALRTGAFTPPPLALVLLGIVLYVIVVGPVDWFVLKRLKKQRLTTLTFLGAVVAFTLVAYGASMFIFSSGSRVNRLVFADLADAGRDGRQVLRLHDLAGYYSPVGADQPVAYSMTAALMTSALPGSDSDDLGSSLPVEIAGAEALRPRAVVQIPFRSQRVVRVQSVGSFGPTIEIEWNGSGADRGVRVVNGLPVDLDEVVLYVDEKNSYSLGPAKSGATTKNGEFVAATERRPLGVPPNRQFQQVLLRSRGFQSDLSAVEVRRLMESISLAGSGNTPDGMSSRETAALAKSGIARGGAIARGRGLLVAFASRAPVPLPGSEEAGDTYVVLRKEVALP